MMSKVTRRLPLCMMLLGCCCLALATWNSVVIAEGGGGSCNTVLTQQKDSFGSWRAYGMSCSGTCPPQGGEGGVPGTCMPYQVGNGFGANGAPLAYWVCACAYPDGSGGGTPRAPSLLT